MKRIFFSLCAILILSGCIPRYATIRPGYDVDVRNREGEPIPNATLWVRTGRSPPGYFPPPEQFQSDAQGHIHVEKKSRWEKIIFFIHGTNFYRWSWCIEAPGYTPRSGVGEAIRSPLILASTGQTERCPDAKADADDLSSRDR
ncbi:membrane lipoprotein lipid attachment site-containing protein [Kosakonia sp.]|uniref:membrane lipoprotein lipid attachment site-containing protein n=1 Tax=Kosakonia sp. TaxID=1916651 RepID=UPI00390CB319